MKIKTRPIAIVDENRCRDNIKRISDKMKRLDIDYRPHLFDHYQTLDGKRIDKKILS